MERLLPLSADVKRSLTARESVTFQFRNEGKRIKLRLSRDFFESKTADLIDRTRLTVNKMLRETKVPWSDVTRLLLVGGSTRMPMVQKMLE